MTSHIMAKNAFITTTINPHSFKEVTVSLGITGNYIVISIEPYVIGEYLAHVTNHFLDGKGNVKIDVSVVDILYIYFVRSQIYTALYGGILLCAFPLPLADVLPLFPPVVLWFVTTL